MTEKIFRAMNTAKAGTGSHLGLVKFSLDLSMLDNFWLVLSFMGNAANHTIFSEDSGLGGAKIVLGLSIN